MKVVNPTAKLGENAAVAYLASHNYTVLERNFHARGGEIDVIAVDTSEKEPVLAFIEVKTRTSHAYGTPFEAIHFRKIHSMKKTAIYYTILHKNLPKNLRIDAVSVMLTSLFAVGKIELLKNITE